MSSIANIRSVSADALSETIIAIADWFADQGDYDTGLKVAHLADRVGEAAA